MSIEEDHVEVNAFMQEFVRLNEDEIIEWLSTPIHYSSAENDEPCSGEEALKTMNSFFAAAYTKDAFAQLISGNRDEMTAGALWFILSYMTPAQFKKYGIPEFAKGIVTEDMLLVKNDMYTLVIPRYIHNIMPFYFVAEHKIEEIVILSDIKRLECDGCFPLLKSLKRVVLPDGLEEIGVGAFSECENLETVVIPDSVKIIDDYAFSACPKLRINKLPPKIELIGEAAFYGNEYITELFFPPNTIVVGPHAFFDCKNIKKVVVSSAVVNAEAVDRLSVKPESSTNRVWDDVPCFFDDNNNIESIYLSNLEIISYFFEGSSALKEVVIGSGAKIIGKYAFMEMSALEEIVIPDGVLEIENNAFAYCQILKRVVLPASIIKIAEDAFENSTNVQIEYKDSLYSYADLEQLYSCINASNK